MKHFIPDIKFRRFTPLQAKTLFSTCCSSTFEILEIFKRLEPFSDKWMMTTSFSKFQSQGSLRKSVNYFASCQNLIL